MRRPPCSRAPQAAARVWAQNRRRSIRHQRLRSLGFRYGNGRRRRRNRPSPSPSFLFEPASKLPKAEAQASLTRSSSGRCEVFSMPEGDGHLGCPIHQADLPDLSFRPWRIHAILSYGNIVTDVEDDLSLDDPSTRKLKLILRCDLLKMAAVAQLEKGKNYQSKWQLLHSLRRAKTIS